MSLEDEFWDVNSGPLIYCVDSRCLMNTVQHVSWWKIFMWLRQHPQVTVMPFYQEYHTTLEFPSRELLLEFMQTFPGLLRGDA